MRKTSVYIPDGLKRRLAALAERTHRSEAELLRTAVDALVSGGHEPSPPEAPVSGRLVGVGVGPGPADLLTVRALRAVRRAGAVVAPSTDVAAAGRAEAILREAAPDVVVERLVFVMARDQAARASALAGAVDRVVELLDVGEEVAFITLGDPNLYSTFSSVAAGVLDRRPGTPVLTVPGVMAFQELAARSGTVLADDQQSFLVLPANESSVSAAGGALAAALADASCTVVVYKGGRQVAAVADRLREAGRLDGAVIGELLGMPGERVAAVADVAARPASYLSAVIAPAFE
ncbi:MAG: precorrin-2 C(20)-methyltransferase [Actinobacteria bacterium]|nr:precorrin-2 C(20)-methyltransferase [Actinomycetota bacterium]